MKPHVIISIQDPNSFFALGIQNILQEYFLAKAWALNFVSISSEIKADLIIRAESIGDPIRRYRFRRKQREGRFGTIVVNEVITPCVKQDESGKNNFFVLGRREQPDAMVRLVDELFSQVCPQSLPERKESGCDHLQLTPRELEVLEGIAWELTPGQIANKLMLNVKTVSSHKLTAMRKLGFKRNSELYHWLFHGGLAPKKDALTYGNGA